MNINVARFVLLLVFVTSLWACAPTGTEPLVADAVATGSVYLAQPGTTLYWVNQAFQGAGGTQVLAKDGSYFVTWVMPGNQGMGFTLMKEQGGAAVTQVIDWYKATGGKGNISNYQDMKTFLQYLKDNGWTVVGAKGVSSGLKAMVKGAWESVKVAGPGALEALAAWGQNLVSIVVMPIAVVPTGGPSEIPDMYGYDHWE